MILDDHIRFNFMSSFLLDERAGSNARSLTLYFVGDHSVATPVLGRNYTEGSAIFAITGNEIAELYKEQAPNVSLVFNFDSSGTLKTQIEEGADCDVFISAAPKQMNELDGSKDAESGNPDGLDFVLQGTRIDLLENKVALAVPDGNPAGISSYEDLAAGLGDGSIMLAMGNADVPVGQYTQKILAYYDLSEEDLAAAGSITYGSNVKEVTTQVSEAGAVSERAGYGLVSTMELPADRGDRHSHCLFCRDILRVLHRKGAAHRERRSGRAFDHAAGAAAHGGGIFAAAASGAEAASRRVGALRVWRQNDHDLVVRCFCHRRGDLSADVPDSQRRLRVL